MKIIDGKFGPGSAEMGLAAQGRAYGNTGRPDDAGPLLRRSLKMLETRFGPTHIELVPPLRSLARVEHAFHHDEDAVNLLTRLLPIEEATFGKDHLEVAAILIELSSDCAIRGQLERPAPPRTRGRIREAQLGQKSLFLSYALDDLGLCLRDLGAFAEAEPLLLRALKIKETRWARLISRWRPPSATSHRFTTAWANRPAAPPWPSVP